MVRKAVPVMRPLPLVSPAQREEEERRRKEDEELQAMEEEARVAEDSQQSEATALQKKKGPAPSLPMNKSQLLFFCGLLMEKENILMDKRHIADSNKAKNAAWAAVRDAFNSKYFSDGRDLKYLRKRFETLGSQCRARISLEASHRGKTGGGGPLAEPEDYLKLLLPMFRGQKSATGLTRGFASSPRPISPAPAKKRRIREPDDSPEYEEEAFPAESPASAFAEEDVEVFGGESPASSSQIDPQPPASSSYQAKASRKKRTAEADSVDTELARYTVMETARVIESRECLKLKKIKLEHQAKMIQKKCRLLNLQVRKAKAELVGMGISPDSDSDE
jgi:hypothetical protein